MEKASMINKAFPVKNLYYFKVAKVSKLLLICKVKIL